MKFFNQLLRGIFLLILGANILLYATGIEGRTITDNKTNPSIVNTSDATEIIDLSGKDLNGDSVSSFIIRSLPMKNQGILYMLDGKSTVRVGQVLTLIEANGLKFDPDGSFVGDAEFTYIAVADNGVRGNVGTVTIPVVAPSIVSPTEVEKPTADDKVNPEMLNTLGAVNILDLSGTDSSGDAVNTFIVTSLPSAEEGVLYLSDKQTPVCFNQTITLEEANGLTFDPAVNFVGDVLFTYVAVDDNGFKSNPATVTIPLIAPSSREKPIADDKVNPEMLNTLGAVNILDLSGTDSNGDAIDSFIITSLPNINQGILYFADGKSRVKLNQILTQEESNGLKFDPNINFIGNVKFTYMAVDTNGIKSTNATVTIPLIPSYNTDIVAYDDEGFANDNAEPIIIDVLANDTGTLDGATVYLIDNDNGEHMLQELIVTGEGVWSVADNNSVVFTPISPFIGIPTSVSYLVQDSNGALSNSATVGISGRCVCKAYRENIPVFTSLGLLFMTLFSIILGSLLIKREVLD